MLAAGIDLNRLLRPLRTAAACPGGVDESAFVAMREARDANLAAPLGRQAAIRGKQ